MVVVGVDPHKKNHTAVAVDENGRGLATKTVRADEQGHLALLKWALGLTGSGPAGPGQLVWGVEDGRHVATRLLRHLVAAGQDVRPVPPHLMAQVRRNERSRGKSDPIDARSVARVVLREPDLPRVLLDQPSRDLRLLVDHREMLVAQRTANINRVRWDLVVLAPGLEPGTRRLVTQRVLRHLIAQLKDATIQAGFDPADAVLVELTLDLLHRILADTIVINDLTRRIEDRVTPVATELLTIPGVGALTAAKLHGEIAGIDRFSRSAQLARISGTACVPVWTGNHEKHRLDRGGNRQINAAVHRVAITQARCHPPAQALLQRRRTQHHDTKRGAIRVLKRHLIDAIYHAMKTDAQRLRATTHQPQPTAA
jgi:transposase